MSNRNRFLFLEQTFKARLSPSKKKFFICFSESPLKMIKKFILKALFVLKTFQFLSSLFGHVEKAARLER